MRNNSALKNFRKETVVLIDSNDPAADGVFQFGFGTGKRPIPEKDARLRRDLGLDFSSGCITDPKLRGRIATVLRDRGSITDIEIKILGGRIIRTERE
jgi:hypothetical protein